MCGVAPTCRYRKTLSTVPFHSLLYNEDYWNAALARIIWADRAARNTWQRSYGINYSYTLNAVFSG